MKNRTRYTKEFKFEAVRLLFESKKSITAIAHELGVKRASLYRWKDQLENEGDKAFQGPGRPKADQVGELTKLRQELKAVKEERDILKKAAAYFARDLK